MRNTVGGLAWIERGSEGDTGPNVGLIVQCLEIVLGNEGKHHTEYGPVWQVESRGHPIVTQHGGYGMYAHVPDAWLRPIPPDLLPPDGKLTGLDIPEDLAVKIKHRVKPTETA
jgi:hypothetical protein